MGLVLREATLADAPLLAELTRSAWRQTVAVTSSGHRETAVQVAEHLQHGGGFILLIDEQPAGAVRWLPVDGAADVWQILRMGVLPDYRGRHLSQHLLEAVLHHAQSCGVEELRLAVRAEQTRLVHLYAAYGFELAPELEYGLANPVEPPPVVMRRRLRR
ncbi:GNAT family N-acetyltransferase|uniref:GNAT family N-acetyltransferase n=1 Tax=Noviherbaspirillum sp. L7-7A TaxID=2850560 RepID=UPI001C2C7D16|nr:GNAT family N-acetyltransferase [Noviherbaspirillum sp. L7-7A]MBV0878343.1 GNAT family N-acetyltransferase [Noviherbaspirillum sp. L7-7A]